jgi:hypothetical protein
MAAELVLPKQVAMPMGWANVYRGYEITQADKYTNFDRDGVFRFCPVWAPYREGFFVRRALH